MLFNYYCQNVVPLSMSDEVEAGSGGDRPVRNNLTEWNGKGGQNFLLPFFLFQSLMPKKTHCFDRNKSENITFINLKKGQHILGQDRESSARQKSREPKVDAKFKLVIEKISEFEK